jgi:hypothetical protein
MRSNCRSSRLSPASSIPSIFIAIVTVGSVTRFITWAWATSRARSARRNPMRGTPRALRARAKAASSSISKFHRWNIPMMIWQTSSVGVELETELQTESLSQRGRDRFGVRRRSAEREGRNLDAYRPTGWPGSDVEHALFQHDQQFLGCISPDAVKLIHQENGLGFDSHEDVAEIVGRGEALAGRRNERNKQLVGQDACQCGFAKSAAR